jgi:hypothetical protein
MMAADQETTSMSALPQTAVPLDQLYEQDETAWLEAMADLAARGRLDELDTAHLSEYLTDMAIRDRRKVYSRLIVLLAHLLKWDHQPEKRTGSWRATINLQRIKLRLLLASRTLRNHAEAILGDAYRDARKLAADETGLPPETFPAECPYTIDQLLTD